MASASQIQLSLDHCGQFHVGSITQESADAASQVLQENHETHHIFFNQSGFHNHIAHHILTIFALGASPSAIQKHYANNKSYQRPHQPVDNDVLEQLQSSDAFMKYLGQERYFHDYLLFFQSEIEKKGYEEVINEYMFKGDDRANAILVRMYAGFLHPLIHLGFGIEFHQPAIVAEALAQAAAHDAWIGSYLLQTEEAAQSSGQSSKSLVEILDQIRADPKLRNAAHWDDGNKIRDGILARAPDEMIKHASQWTVDVEDLELKTAEMTNAAVYFTGTAQHPPKQIKFDFYYMHCTNSSIFFSSFLHSRFIPPAQKARLLKFKGYLDLAMYASRHAPELLLDEIVNYGPKCALRHGEEICRPYDNNNNNNNGDDPRFRIKGGMWLKLGHMAPGHKKSVNYS
ncbi:MAG: hypothetical protein LQ350_001739 [Teloschistes chrysophthalmus]|nr:MAG: hypothetical protein LQ350_001739 [Niorma chrysophthalma]